MSLVTHLKKVSVIILLAQSLMGLSATGWARGKNSDSSVDKLMNSFNEYSKQTTGSMTEAQVIATLAVWPETKATGASAWQMCVRLAGWSVPL